jgi:hypothetical protein
VGGALWCVQKALDAPYKWGKDCEETALFRRAPPHSLSYSCLWLF